MEGKVTEKQLCCHATTLDLPFPHVEHSERLRCSKTRILTLNVRQMKRCVCFFFSKVIFNISHIYAMMMTLKENS